MIAGAASLVKVDGSKDGTVSAPAAVVTQADAAESEAAPVVIRNAQIKLAQLAVSPPYRLDYERGPRIIHVPQPSERSARQPAARASLERRPEPAATEEDDEEEFLAPPPPRPRVVMPKPRMAAPPPDKTPRWKLRSETPPAPPPIPRRAVLSAPPLSADGPTPLRPTPRYDTKAADSGDKFAGPRAPAAAAPVVSETQPPLGYSPPVTPEPPPGYAPPAEETSATPAAPLPQD